MGWAVIFSDRADAGRRLAEALHELRHDRPIIVGLPRGGVLVAAEVARSLRAPLDVVLVRKLGAPDQPELALGALGEDDVLIRNERLIRAAGLVPEEFAGLLDRAGAELAERATRYRGECDALAVAGRPVVVVDDGIATGATARAACSVLRVRGATRIVVAVPVAPPGWEQQFAQVADACVALQTPRRFSAIGQWYEDFSQSTDDEVTAALRAAAVPPS